MSLSRDIADVLRHAEEYEVVDADVFAQLQDCVLLVTEDLRRAVTPT